MTKSIQISQKTRNIQKLNVKPKTVAQFLQAYSKKCVMMYNKQPFTKQEPMLSFNFAFLCSLFSSSSSYEESA